MNTALIVVDMQNDFMDTSSAPLPVAGALKLVDRINKTICDLEKQALIVFTKDWHNENSPHFQKWPKHCVEKSFGAELVGSLCVPPDSVIVAKGLDNDGYSGFEGFTFIDGHGELTLDELLKIQNIQNVYVCGVATDYCVRATALDAKRLGYNTYLITNCIAGVAPDTTDTALAEMTQAGVVNMQFHI